MAYVNRASARAIAGPGVVWPLATMAWLLACGSGDDCDEPGRCNSCIAEGARISTPDGLVAIERVRVGDEIWAVDPTNGKRHRTKVTHIQSVRRECLRVTDERGRQLTATPDHPVWSASHDDYVPIGRLVAAGQGSMLRVDSGAPKPARLQELDVFVGVHRVFDLTVEHPLHNFVVEGFVVHNKLPPNLTASATLPGSGTETEGTESGTQGGSNAETGSSDATSSSGTDGIDTSSTAGTASSTGATGSGTTTVGPSTDGTTSCEPRTEDGTAIGMECDPNGAPCPAGYTCLGFSGIVQQFSCQIECKMSCDCPPEHTCQEMRDKAGTFTVCAL